jgi:translation initiation factor 5
MSFVTDDKRDTMQMSLCLVHTDDPDPYYRYTICRLVIRTKNTGKMKRTYFENLDAICETLNIPSTIMAPFFAYTLSVASISAKGKNSPAISGCFTKIEINEIFKRFIRNIASCGKCLLPETDICIRKSRNEVYLRCQACGHRTYLDQLVEVPNQYIRFLLKAKVNMPRRKLGVASDKSKSRRRRRSEESKSGEGSSNSKEFRSKEDEMSNNTEVEWFTDISDQAVERRRNCSKSAVIDKLLQ